MKVLMLLSLVTVVLADEDGRYFPDNSGQYVSTGDDGQYYPDDSGKYVHDGLGGYAGDGSGRYADDGSGRYSGQNSASFGGRNLGGSATGFGNINGNFLGSATSNNQVFRPSPKLAVTKIAKFENPSQSASKSVNYNVRANNYQNGKWKIIRQLGDVDTDGYHWEYETENKIIAEESGKLHNKGTDAEAIRAKGFFQYTGPDNVVYSVTYTADENGFVPVGDHLPTPPPIPAAIVKALAFNNAKNKI